MSMMINRHVRSFLSRERRAIALIAAGLILLPAASLAEDLTIDTDTGKIKVETLAEGL